MTKEETIGGPHTQKSIRIKGSIPALYVAQADLEETGQKDVTWQEHPPSSTNATTAIRWQTTQWETVKTYSPHSWTPEPCRVDKIAGEKVKSATEQDGTETARTRPPSTGFIKAINAGAKYGFIRKDYESDIFVMPSSCTGFENKIPPIGTRVAFNTKYDTKSGKENAILVRPETAGHSGGRSEQVKYTAEKPIGA